MTRKGRSLCDSADRKPTAKYVELRADDKVWKMCEMAKSMRVGWIKDAGRREGSAIRC